MDVAVQPRHVLVHSMGVRREMHISNFTRTIYFQGIAVSVAFGDIAPLVGHNAFLRWSAMKQVGVSSVLAADAKPAYDAGKTALCSRVRAMLCRQFTTGNEQCSSQQLCGPLST